MLLKLQKYLPKITELFDTHEYLVENNAIYRDVYEAQVHGSGDFDEGGDN